MNALGMLAVMIVVAFVTSFLMSVLIGKTINRGAREPEFYVKDWEDRVPRGVNHERK